MAVYWFSESQQDRELAQGPSVARAMQPVQPAIGARGEHLAANQRRLAVLSRFLRVFWHGAHGAPALPCVSSTNGGERTAQR